MYDYIKTLQQAHLPTSCGTAVVIAIGDRIRDSDNPLAEAYHLISQITSTAVDNLNLGDDKHRVRLTAQYLGALIFKHGESFTPSAGLAAAVVKANRFRDDPANSYHFSDMTPGSSTHVETKSIGGVDVEVKADGRVKKGGNAVVAMQLYKDNVVAKQMETKQFIQLLMTTLNMSKAGATTYAYATRKKYNEENGA